MKKIIRHIINKKTHNDIFEGNVKLHYIHDIINDKIFHEIENELFKFISIKKIYICA
jgi:hypothetical protein